MWLRSAGTTLILQLRSGGDHSDPGLAPAGNTLIRGVLFGFGGDHCDAGLAVRVRGDHSDPGLRRDHCDLALAGEARHRDHSHPGLAVQVRRGPVEVRQEPLLSGGDHCDHKLAVEGPI